MRSLRRISLFEKIRIQPGVRPTFADADGAESGELIKQYAPAKGTQKHSRDTRFLPRIPWRLVLDNMSLECWIAVWSNFEEYFLELDLPDDTTTWRYYLLGDRIDFFARSYSLGHNERFGTAIRLGRSAILRAVLDLKCLMMRRSSIISSFLPFIARGVPPIERLYIGPAFSTRANVKDFPTTNCLGYAMSDWTLTKHMIRIAKTSNVSVENNQCWEWIQYRNIVLEAQSRSTTRNQTIMISNLSLDLLVASNRCIGVGSQAFF